MNKKYTTTSQEEILIRNVLAVKRTLKLTMKNIGDATGINGSTVSTYLTGLRKMNSDWPERFCKAYHVDKDWLYNGSGGPVFLSELTSMEIKDSSMAPSRLLETRKSMGMKQYEFAKALGISRQMYSTIEAGHARLTEQIAERFENKFGIGSDWLLYGDETRKFFPVCSRMISFLWDNAEERKRLWKIMKDNQE